MVTEARCAGGEEGVDAAARSAPAKEAGMDTDAPKGGATLGGGALVIKAAGASESRWAALFCFVEQFLLTWGASPAACDQRLLPWPAWTWAMATWQCLVMVRGLRIEANCVCS